MPLHERRIVGPPGCGKTTEVARQVRQIVDARGPDSVLVMSFTRAAAKAAAGRDLPIADERVGTIHAMCYRALDRPELVAKGDNITQWNESHPDWELSGQRDTSEPEATFSAESAGDPLLQDYQRLRAQMQPRESWPGEVLAFASEYDGWKEDGGLVDFTDLIEIAMEEIPTPPLDASIMLIDESQDLVPSQWALIRRWAESCEYIYSVGDADQLLYSWLGATVESMLVPVEQEKTLDQSYRVPRLVVDKATAWIEQASRRAPTVYKARDADGYLGQSTATWKQPQDLVEELLKRPLDRSAMVLAATGYMLKPLIAMLRQQGVPFGNRYATRRGDWNPLGNRRGTTTVDRMLALLRPAWPDKPRFWTLEDVYLFVDPMRSKDYLKRGAKKKLRDMEPLERTKTEADVTWLLEHIFEEQTLAALFELDVDFWLESLTKAKSGPAQYPSRIYRRYGVAGLQGRPTLTIGSIHSVKGGESSDVYLFPDLSRAGYRQWLEHGEPRDSVLRQFYVGMTRAREGLTICSPTTSCSVPIMEG